MSPRKIPTLVVDVAYTPKVSSAPMTTRLFRIGAYIGAGKRLFACKIALAMAMNP